MIQNRYLLPIMIIRKFKKEDTDKVVEIWFNSSLQSHSFISRALLLRQREEVIMKYLLIADSWVAEEDGEVLGFISMLEKYIGGLFVSPRHQRKKVGSSLINKVKEDKGSLAVGVYEKNPGAKLFYEKLGFRYVNKELQSETNEYVLNMVLNSD
jgi:GNAT superfamily N-acetyltransferase